MKNVLRTGALCFALVLPLALPAAAGSDTGDKSRAGSAATQSKDDDRSISDVAKDAEVEATPGAESTRRTINEGSSFDRDPRNNVDDGQERRDLGNLGKQ